MFDPVRGQSGLAVEAVSVWLRVEGLDNLIARGLM